MKFILSLMLLLSALSLAGQPVAVISKQYTENDISYSVPTIPFDGTKATVRLKIKAHSHIPEGSRAIGNYPLKVKSISIYLNGKKLKLPKKIEDKLPSLGLSVEGSLHMIPIENRSIRIQFNISENYAFIDISPKGEVTFHKSN